VPIWALVLGRLSVSFVDVHHFAEAPVEPFSLQGRVQAPVEPFSLQGRAVLCHNCDVDLRAWRPGHLCCASNSGLASSGSNPCKQLNRLLRASQRFGPWGARSRTISSRPHRSGRAPFRGPEGPLKPLRITGRRRPRSRLVTAKRSIRRTVASCRSGIGPERAPTRLPQGAKTTDLALQGAKNTWPSETPRTGPSSTILRRPRPRLATAKHPIRRTIASNG